jgi:ABC-type xylose transport system permease subunit
MFMLLLLITLLVALGVSFAVAKAFAKPLDAILQRIIADSISAAWLKYMKFAILVVGVSSGVRVREFEKYITPSRWEKDAKVVEFTFERWVLELYRTAIETLQGIAWMLLVFFVFALVAYVIVRIAELKLGERRDK